MVHGETRPFAPFAGGSGVVPPCLVGRRLTPAVPRLFGVTMSTVAVERPGHLSPGCYLVTARSVESALVWVVYGAEVVVVVTGTSQSMSYFAVGLDRPLLMSPATCH